MKLSKTLTVALTALFATASATSLACTTLCSTLTTAKATGIQTTIDAANLAVTSAGCTCSTGTTVVSGSETTGLGVLAMLPVIGFALD